MLLQVAYMVWRRQPSKPFDLISWILRLEVAIKRQSKPPGASDVPIVIVRPPFEQHHMTVPLEAPTLIASIRQAKQ